MSSLLARVPLARALRGYDRDAFRGDALAGVTTAIMLIPQGMAYAMLAGLDPIIGLYASTVPLLIYALLGSSRQLAVGPVAMVSLMVAAGVGPLAGGDPLRYAALAALLALIVGVMQLGMGLARAGFLVRFLSHPVIAGFTSAAALIIGLSQLKHVLGAPIPRSSHVHEIVIEAVRHASEIHPLTLAVAAVSTVTLVVLKRFAPRFPRFLLVVVGGAAAVWGFGLEARGVAIVGDVPSGLPMPSLPAFELSVIGELAPVAIAIALVAFMESISVAKAFAKQGRYEVDADQELVALGAANIGGAFFHAYPVTGGFSRTAVNAAAGARTGMASLITAGLVVLTLLVLTPLFHFLPKAVLASIIMTAVFGLIDVQEARHLFKVSRPDLALMGLTFVATLVLGIEPGIGVGVGASLLAFVWRTSKPHIAILGRLPGTTVYRNVRRHPDATTTAGVLAVRVDAPLFFANTAFLKSALTEAEAQVSGPLRAVVLDAKAIGSIDASGEGALQEIIDAWLARDVAVWLAGLRGPVQDVLESSGLIDRIGRDHLVHRVHEAVDQVRAGPTLHEVAS